MDSGTWWATVHGDAEWDMTERLTHTMKTKLQSTDRVKNLTRGSKEKIRRIKMN